MSCHHIGMGMNWVAEKILQHYDAGDIDFRTTVDLIHTTTDAVNWCDGNEDEAVDTIAGYRCGKCLKHLEEDDPVFSLWDTYSDVPEYGVTEHKRIYEHEEVPIAFPFLCADCFDEVLAYHTGDPASGPQQRAAIKARTRSTAAEFRDDNLTWRFFMRRDKRFDRRQPGDNSEWNLGWYTRF